MNTIALKDIVIDERMQSRVALNQITIDEYAEIYTRDGSMNAITLFQEADDAPLILVDGFHRYHAAKKAGLTAIDATIHQGSLREAMLFAIAANTAHGLQRTNEDKRKAVEMMLSDNEWSTWSDSGIAKHCKVDHKTVTAIRKKLTWEIPSNETPDTRTYRTKHGTIAKMNTANIGKRHKSQDTDTGSTNDMVDSELQYNCFGLLPCPFCGGSYVECITDSGWDMAMCQKDGCCVIGPRCKSEDKAKEAWNQRS